MLSKRADVLESSFRRFLSLYQFLKLQAITRRGKSSTSELGLTLVCMDMEEKLKQEKLPFPTGKGR